MLISSDNDSSNSSNNSSNNKQTTSSFSTVFKNFNPSNFFKKHSSSNNNNNNNMSGPTSSLRRGTAAVSPPTSPRHKSSTASNNTNNTNNTSNNNAKTVNDINAVNRHYFTANNVNHRHSKNPLRGAVTIIPNRLYFCALHTDPASTASSSANGNSRVLQLKNPFDADADTLGATKQQVNFFSVDADLVYWNFFLDFGPLNLGQLARFCEKLHYAMQNNKVVCLYSSASAKTKRTNAIYCICAWQILYCQRTPEEALFGFFNSDSNPNNSNGNRNSNKEPTINSSLPPLQPFTEIGQWTVAPLPSFHDASPCMCTYDLTLLHCLQGLQKARQYNFFTWNDLGRKYSHNNNHNNNKSLEDIVKNNERNPFDVKEYEHFEQVENGDLNWLVQGKILAFAGPSYKKTISPEGYCTLAPSDYIPYFKTKNVGLVVRLNKKMYEEQDFKDAGIDHMEQFYLDGSCPPMKILQRVVAAFEAVPKEKGFAVHCKAGLGRTGTCIGAYLMKHYKFTAAEAIGWMRICRPGMVIGPQQHFLQQIQSTMWQEGEWMRTDPRTGHLAIRLIKSMPSPSPDLSAVHLHYRPSNSISTTTPPSTPKRSKQMHPSPSSSAYTSKHQRPAMVTPIASKSAESCVERQQHFTSSASRDEAIVGRAGQADGLLAARGSRRNPNNKSGTSGWRDDPPASYTFENNGHAVPITPDPPASNTNNDKLCFSNKNRSPTASNSPNATPQSAAT